MTVVLLLAGFALLLAGAELLVRGASRLAAAAAISPLVIGLTVVAFGTSAPELAVSLLAAAQEQADLAVGNVVGSNIFNVLLVLGVSGLIAPLVVAVQLVRIEVPLMIAASVAVPLLAPLTLLKHHLATHDAAYALNQRYLQPHPAEAGLRREL